MGIDPGKVGLRIGAAIVCQHDNLEWLIMHIVTYMFLF